MTHIHLNTITMPGHRAPGAGYEAPFEMLEACHERVERILRLLQRLRVHLQTKGRDQQAVEAARDVLRYFDQAAPHHHADEERHVFPAVLAAPDAPIMCSTDTKSETKGGASLHALVYRLQQDHLDMQTNWDSARPVLERVVQPAADLWQPLNAAEEAILERFASLYASHIKAENQVIYPAAQRALSQTAQHSMSKDMMARRGVVLQNDHVTT